MDDIATSSLLGILAVLLVSSALFSAAETAMMAVNRYRLRHRAEKGVRGAKLALSLLAETDKLLGVILLGNNLINAAAATLTTVITVRLFGAGEGALALGTVAITFGILVFSEITPKVIGAAYADRLAPLVSYALMPLLRPPVVWIVRFVNIFVQGLLKLFHLKPSSEPATALSQEELRSLVLEGSQYFRGKHRAILANIFDLESVSVDDVMVPRNQIDAIDLNARPTVLAEQVATSYHTRVPVFEDELDNIVGVIHLKQVVSLQKHGEVTAEDLRSILRPPYFVPMGTSLLTQLQHFQTNHQRLGLVVDEYGELSGLLTLEDIVEEIIGEFTTQAPGSIGEFQREPNGNVVVDGTTPLRTLNRKLGTAFPLDGPKTLNGLIIEHFGDIPEAGVSLRIGAHTVDILQTQDRVVKIARLILPAPAAKPPSALQSPGEQASSKR